MIPTHSSRSSDSSSGIPRTERILGRVGKQVGSERRTALILASRARRKRELSLIQEMGHTLPVDELVAPEYKGRPLDKATILRLAVSYLKLQRMVDWFGAPPTALQSSSNMHSFIHTTVQECMGTVLEGGFILVMTPDGLVTYVSTATLDTLGFSSMDIIGKSIYEWIHPSDFTEVQRLLTIEKTNSISGQKRSELVRIKLSARISRNPYRVFHVRGKLFPSPPPGNFFVGIVQSIPHPGDNGFPMFTWSHEQIFTSLVSPDFQCATFSFANRVPAECQSAITRYTGFALWDVCGVSCLEMIHPGDLVRFSKDMKILQQKGQSVGEYRCLRKNGGYVRMLTQSTYVDSNGKVTTQNPAVIIVRNHVLEVYDTDEIYAEIQIVGGRRASTTSESDIYLPETPREGTPMYPTSFVEELSRSEGSISPSPTEMEMEMEASPFDLVPADELERLEQYLQSHEVSWWTKASTWP